VNKIINDLKNKENKNPNRVNVIATRVSVIAHAIMLTMPVILSFTQVDLPGLLISSGALFIVFALVLISTFFADVMALWGVLLLMGIFLLTDRLFSAPFTSIAYLIYSLVFTTWLVKRILRSKKGGRGNA